MPLADAVSFAYVVGDTIDKGYKDYADGKGAVAVGKMGLDVLLWQTLASVAVPGLTINMAVRFSIIEMAMGLLCLSCLSWGECCEVAVSSALQIPFYFGKSYRKWFAASIPRHAAVQRNTSQKSSPMAVAGWSVKARTASIFSAL